MPIIPTSFESFSDEYSGQGKRPVVFDILASDRRTSILPPELKLVLHVNPRSMKLNYQKLITRIQTRGGFVEQHWGDALEDISFEFATGGFVRLYTGLSNKTGSTGSTGKLSGSIDNRSNPLGTGKQGRRETIAYDRYLDLLALWLNNGSIHDARGEVVGQGYIKITFDGGIYYGWFDTDFVITEAAEKPYQFDLTARFQIDLEELALRSTILNPFSDAIQPGTGTPTQNQPIFGEGVGGARRILGQETPLGAGGVFS